MGSEFLEEFTEENGGVATVATELDEVAGDVPCEGLLGKAKDFRGFVRGDLVVDDGFGDFDVFGDFRG